MWMRSNEERARCSLLVVYTRPRSRVDGWRDRSATLCVFFSVVFRSSFFLFFFVFFSLFSKCLPSFEHKSYQGSAAPAAVAARRV
jgi:hypothetical protein